MSDSTAVVEPAPVVPTTPEASSVSVPVESVVTSAESVASAATPPVADPNTPAPSEGEAPSTPASVDNPQRPSRAQERIEDLVAERNAAREYAEFWRDRALRDAPTTAPAAVTPPAPAADPAPTLDQFSYDTAKWAEAQAKWNERQIAQRVKKEVAEAVRGSNNQQALEAASVKYEERVAAFAKKVPDFQIVTNRRGLPQLAQEAAQLVVQSDLGAELTYHLCSNPDKLARITRQSPIQQAAAIGRLEQELSMPTPTPAAQPTPVVAAATPRVAPTRAPAPPTPVSTGGAAVRNMETMDPIDWMAARRNEMKAAKRR